MKKKTTKKEKSAPKKSKDGAKKEKVAGLVTHYFDHIGVAVINLSTPLKVGDEIRIKGGEVDFTQTVSSMELEHEKVESVKKGASIGLKVDKKVHEGYKVYKVA